MRALWQLGSPGQQISSDTAPAQECGSHKQAGRAGQDQGDARQCNTEGGPVSSAGFEEGAGNSRLGMGVHHPGLSLHQQSIVGGTLPANCHEAAHAASCHIVRMVIQGLRRLQGLPGLERFLVLPRPCRVAW